VDGTGRGQTFINTLVWENGYTQVVNSATWWDALLEVYSVRPESLVNYCTTEQGISNHCGVLREWEENYCRPQVERLVTVYNKTIILGLRIFLPEKLIYTLLVWLDG
jgi:hypothetical protein